MASCTASSSSVLVDTALPQTAFSDKDEDDGAVDIWALNVPHDELDDDDEVSDEYDDANVDFDCKRDLAGRRRTSALNDESRSRHASSW